MKIPLKTQFERIQMSPEVQEFTKESRLLWAGFQLMNSIITLKKCRSK